MLHKDLLFKTLSFYVEQKTITEAEAKKILMLPVIEIDDVKDPGPWADFLDHPDQNKHNPEEMFITRDDFILLESAYSIPGFGIYVFKLSPVDPANEYGPITISADILSEEYGPKRRAVRLTCEVILDQFHPDEIKINNIVAHYAGHSIKVTADMVENREMGMIKVTAGLRLIHFFNRFQEGLDRYPVEVKPAKVSTMMRSANTTDKRIKQALAKSTRIIFLNTLPVAQTVADVKNQGEVAARKMHQRRGHWKTLRDPRYAKHPKYMIENAIRVRPAFVGSLKGEYNGNVYRVLLPNKNYEG